MAHWKQRRQAAFEIERCGRRRISGRASQGVPDVNTAEMFRNLELYVSREKFPDIEESDEFYVADLVGLQATDKTDAAIGEVVGGA